jgi:PncC family amidohydrolase
MYTKTARFDSETLEKVAQALVKNGQTVAVAESVTAGNLQVAFSMAEGATEFFPGGMTAYNINQKVKHLKVDPVHALACNCVSEQVAKEMAREIAKLFNADWGIAITGYAAPIPEKNITELYACFAIYFREECKICKTVTGKGKDPLAVRYFYSNQVLCHLLEVISGAGKQVI